eukprot:gene27957-34873_t
MKVSQAFLPLLPLVLLIISPGEVLALDGSSGGTSGSGSAGEGDDDAAVATTPSSTAIATADTTTTTTTTTTAVIATLPAGVAALVASAQSD